MRLILHRDIERLRLEYEDETDPPKLDQLVSNACFATKIRIRPLLEGFRIGIAIDSAPNKNNSSSAIDDVNAERTYAGQSKYRKIGTHHNYDSGSALKTNKKL